MGRQHRHLGGPGHGPTVSGLILEHFAWRLMFVFVLAVALAALATGAKFLTNVGETEKATLDALSVSLTVPAFGGQAGPGMVEIWCKPAAVPRHFTAGTDVYPLVELTFYGSVPCC